MIPPEFQLLLYCARSQPNARTIKHLIDGGAIDWPKVLELAKQHGVRALLCQNLKALCWDAVPQSAQLELERFYRSNAQIRYRLQFAEYTLYTSIKIHYSFLFFCGLGFRGPSI
jgi:hypothetical protein